MRNTRTKRQGDEPLALCRRSTLPQAPSELQPHSPPAAQRVAARPGWHTQPQSPSSSPHSSPADKTTPRALQFQPLTLLRIAYSDPSSSHCSPAATASDFDLAADTAAPSSATLFTAAPSSATPFTAAPSSATPFTAIPSSAPSSSPPSSAPPSSPPPSFPSPSSAPRSSAPPAMEFRPSPLNHRCPCCPCSHANARGPHPKELLARIKIFVWRRASRAREARENEQGLLSESVRGSASRDGFRLSSEDVEELKRMLPAWGVGDPSELPDASTCSLAGALDALLRLGLCVGESGLVTHTTPMHLAAFGGHVESMQLLQSHGADILAATVVECWTPLHHATKEQKWEAVRWLARWLAQQGIDPQTVKIPSPEDLDPHLMQLAMNIVEEEYEKIWMVPRGVSVAGCSQTNELGVVVYNP
ncbi:unnamed protein product [Closterium sp. NIES-64]|nr:unnamed protein product [Closterium sp. NIES-64]